MAVIGPTEAKMPRSAGNLCEQEGGRMYLLDQIKYELADSLAKRVTGKNTHTYYTNKGIRSGVLQTRITRVLTTVCQQKRLYLPPANLCITSTLTPTSAGRSVTEVVVVVYNWAY